MVKLYTLKLLDALPNQKHIKDMRIGILHAYSFWSIIIEVFNAMVLQELPLELKNKVIEYPANLPLPYGIPNSNLIFHTLRPLCVVYDMNTEVDTASYLPIYYNHQMKSAMVYPIEMNTKVEIYKINSIYT